jgi:predicted small secreted protein
MRRSSWVLLASAMLVSASCSTMQSWGEDDYVVRSATPDSITLEFRPGNLNVATARAEAHCANRTAKMANVSTTDGKSQATFTCQY